MSEAGTPAVPDPGAPAPAALPSVWPLYRAMVGIGLLCGVLIVTVFQLTRPVILRKQAEALERAIFQVLPEARSSAAVRLGAAGGFEALAQETAGDDVVYAGYDEGGKLVGVAIEAKGMGYQDVIRMLYGYSFRQSAIIGIRVLESRETPGLGDRIESDPAFLENFQQLDVSLADDGSALAHPIAGVKHGTKQHPWQVDAITGATISAMAVANALGRSAAVWVPRIHAHLGDFEKVE